MEATTAGGRARFRAIFSSRCSLVVAVLVAAGAVAGLAPPVTTAGAATNAGLEARAETISAALGANEARLARIGVEYLAARGQYATDRVALARSRGDLAVLDERIARARRALYRAAVAFYVAGDDNVLGLLISGRSNAIASGETYLHVATDELQQSAVALGEDRRARVSALATERRETADARLALDNALRARGAALSTARTDAALLASVQGQLAALVAAEQAARARAEAAAAAAAAQAARARAGEGATTSAGPPRAVVTVSTSPVPPGSLARAFAGIRECESGDVYSLNTGNGYYGAYQFSLSTWAALGGTGLPSAAPPADQDAAAYRLYRASGFSSWPECAALLGL